jgi:hypothetical protein
VSNHQVGEEFRSSLSAIAGTMNGQNAAGANSRPLAGRDQLVRRMTGRMTGRNQDRGAYRLRPCPQTCDKSAGKVKKVKLLVGL